MCKSVYTHVQHSCFPQSSLSAFQSRRVSNFPPPLDFNHLEILQYSECFPPLSDPKDHHHHPHHPSTTPIPLTLSQLSGTQFSSRLKPFRKLTQKIPPLRSPHSPLTLPLPARHIPRIPSAFSDNQFFPSISTLPLKIPRLIHNSRRPLPRRAEPLTAPFSLSRERQTDGSSAGGGGEWGR